jgi:hypothetical protein
MDPAPNHSPDGPASAVPARVSPVLPTWDTYYKEASRRRRRNGGDRGLREEKRRRRWRERVFIGVSTALVGAMTLAFYLVLR